MMALVMPYQTHRPQLAEGVFVAPNATLIGDVQLGPQASVWFGAVLRGDVGRIEIGARTNLQDLVCVHMTGGRSQAVIGNDVTVGHGASVHGCRVEDGCLIGIGAVLLDNAVIGAGSLVAAGALVPPNTEVPPHSVLRGLPARVVGEVDDDQLASQLASAAHYVQLAQRYAQQLQAQPLPSELGEQGESH